MEKCPKETPDFQIIWSIFYDKNVIFLWQNRILIKIWP